MKCYYHQHREAVIQCEDCRQGLCPECAIAETNLCLNCLLKWDKKVKKTIFEKTVTIISLWLIIFISFTFIFQFEEEVTTIADLYIIFKLTSLVLFGLEAIPYGWQTINQIRNYLFFKIIEYQRYEKPSNLIIIIGFFLKPILGLLIAPFSLIYQIYKIIKNIIYTHKIKSNLNKSPNEIQEIRQQNPI